MSKKSFRFLSILSALIFIGLSLLARDVFSQPKKNILWRVQSKTNTAYILGSIHYLKKEMYPLHEEIERGYDQSDILVVEANISDIKKVDIQKLMGSAFYPENETLEKNIPTEIYERVKEKLEGVGLPPELFNKQKPWFLAFTLVSIEMSKLGFDPNYGIDKYLLSKAIGKKKILELESFDYQIELFSKLSEKEQELLLLYTLKDINVLEKELNKLIQAWTSGDTNSMESIVTRTVTEDKRLTPIYGKLIYERNRSMAAKIEDYLNTKETYFVIVGAGHLVGNQGIIEILKRKGFVVEQL